MHQWPETKSSLILRVRDPQDHAAWAMFTEIYRPIVVRMALGQGLQAADADDLAQNVFISISRAVSDWEGGQGQPPFRAWLYRIASNAIINAITRARPDRGRGTSTAAAAMEALPDRDSLSQQLQQESRLQTLRWVADSIRMDMHPDTWGMFYESFIEGRPVADVAQKYHRSTGAVYLARYRVVNRMKLKFDEITTLE